MTTSHKHHMPKHPMLVKASTMHLLERYDTGGRKDGR